MAIAQKKSSSFFRSQGKVSLSVNLGLGLGRQEAEGHLHEDPLPATRLPAFTKITEPGLDGGQNGSVELQELLLFFFLSSL